MNRRLGAFANVTVSFPHTRGDEPEIHRERRRAERVFPTPVGMNRMVSEALQLAVSFPHTRGDEPRRIIQNRLFQKGFPHTRGDEPGWYYSIDGR